MFDEAIAEFNEVLKVNPGEALAYYNRGLAYQNKGQYDRAISDYNKAIEIDPGDAKVYYSKAYACERTNNKKEAAEA